jgi:hypothetical protein
MTQFPGSLTTALPSIENQGWDLPSNNWTKTKFFGAKWYSPREGIPVLLQRMYKGVPIKLQI